MKKINLFKAIVFASTLGMALSAWGDYTVNNVSIPVESDIIFNFGTIEIKNWEDLKKYKYKKLKAEGYKNKEWLDLDLGGSSTRRSYSKRISHGLIDYATAVLIKTDKLQTSEYINNNILNLSTTAGIGDSNTITSSNAYDQYNIFKVDNAKDYLGFTISGSDSSNFDTAKMKAIQGPNILNYLYPYDNSYQRVTFNFQNGNSEIINMKYVTGVDATIGITIFFVPSNDFLVVAKNFSNNEISFNSKVGKLIFYSADEPNFAKKEVFNLRIQGSIKIINLPSCKISGDSQSINLGTVSKSQIESGNTRPGYSAPITVECTGGTVGTKNINARFYDVNDETNRSTEGILSLKCNDTQAQGVGVKVRMQQGGGNSSTPETYKNIQLGQRSAMQEIDPTSGLLYTARDPTLINTVNSTNAGDLTSDFTIEARYVKDARAGATITPGCADAKLGIMFNYD